MSTEPWGTDLVGRPRACLRGMHPSSGTRRGGRTRLIASDGGLTIIRLADQRVRTVEAAPSRVRVIDLQPSRTRHWIEDEILIDDVPHVVIDTEEVGRRQPGAWRRL